MSSRLACVDWSFADLASAFRPPSAESDQDLLLAYTQLFLGPGKPRVSPYESVHREGRLMGENTSAVMMLYAQAGFGASDPDPPPASNASAGGSLRPAIELPDHVSVELAFMAYLIEQEALHPSQAELWRSRRNRFLTEHLLRWLPELCNRIQASLAHPFYECLASMAKMLLERETSQLGHTAHGRPPCAPNQGRPSHDASHLAAAGWRRHPNLEIIITPAQCTLCTLCADNCQPAALRVSTSPTMIALSFDPALCNGCRACARFCPEQALRVRQWKPLHAPHPSHRRTIAKGPRVICPDCHRPHIAGPWLDRVVERLGGDEASRHALARCPFCKATVSGDDVGLEIPNLELYRGG